MLVFITDTQSNRTEPDILADVRFKRLIIVSLEGQFLSAYNAPRQGWTHHILESLAHSFPNQWEICGADAYIGEQWVGSTEI
ncbi:hypothetical protein BC355_17615 [Vibrio cholerae]|uniref:Uncharacterized protein n=1 Tax=Vibrio cholerae TaxID=666 RepID=A0A395TFC2_VIBCL|nr:hypothetical protein [Vibrio cholerae]EGR0468618.1 hypothetical protein [Vibrio cholerae]RGP82977.1 hypothetical protein BC355_17615 [Vibrio cholerae]RGP83317.1 hypothetical protein BC353_17575 [Vibrio cholerae]TXY52084.1 hypothetical protein FXE74_19095 [Vibrio cholerae]GIB31713.1 Hypothetical protein VCSRO91_2807 [Vibrio cholerae]